MVKGELTLKSNFFKARCFGTSKIVGGLKLSNGKNLLVYFIPEDCVIEVTYKVNDFDMFPLKEEERIAIIETILKEYATFYKSATHMSVAFCIEQYSLKDKTYLNDDLFESFDIEKNILEEYLQSDYASKSDFKIFRELKSIYDYLEPVMDIVGMQEVHVALNEKLNFEERVDIKYFVNFLLDNDKIDIKLDKGKNILKIVPKELD